MDILQYIISLNKISIIAFVAAGAVVIYELRLMKREHDKKRVPKIPHFNQNEKIDPVSNATPLATEKKSKVPFRINHTILLSFIAVVLVLFGITTFFTLDSKQNQTRFIQRSQITIQEVKSSGIKVLDENGKDIQNDSTKLHPGLKIYIAIETIPESDIDKARIRVNESAWTTEHIITDFNQSWKSYFKVFIIPEGVKSLKIDAQLHSIKDGWLGD
ncbi:hypothetical protein HGB07_00415 [Candidatus Roizmanbacteria bacterium]|nr:hypothetical protein [Candidatus Roizmanbacteria bacterium]